MSAPLHLKAAWAMSTGLAEACMVNAVWCKACILQHTHVQDRITPYKIVLPAAWTVPAAPPGFAWLSVPPEADCPAVAAGPASASPAGHHICHCKCRRSCAAKHARLSRDSQGCRWPQCWLGPCQSEQCLEAHPCSSVSQAGRQLEASGGPHQLQLVALPLQALRSGQQHSTRLAGD